MSEARMRATIAGMILLAVLITQAGCGSGSMTRAFMREGATLGHIQTVAVLPFENLGGGAGTAQRSREITMIQLLTSGLFDVVDKGRVDSLLRDEIIEPGAPLDNATLRRLGQRLGTQAFIVGSIEQGVESRGASTYPEINLTLRLLDAETGTLLWQATGRGSGYSLVDRLFGLAPKTHFDVMVRLLNRMLATIR
jgi:TolB-like protein